MPPPGTRIWASECVILGHHYQRDEVVRFADYRGDSYRLSQMAAEARGSYIVFCGVHFMAESADILARRGQSVVLPDLNAGCSMADMAEIGQVEDAWEQFVRLGLTDDEGNGITPITYMNSTAAIKAFCGERGGLVCTSSNAKGAFDWALQAATRNFSSCPISTWAATPDSRAAFRSTKWWCGIRTSCRAA